MKKIYFISLLVILLSCKKEDTPTSPASTPTLVTSAVLNITESTASCGGYITSDGGKSISQRGICWSTNPVPTTSSNFTIDGSGIGTYSSSMNNLSSNTTYYVRAYAINSVGISYGNQVAFTTTSSIASITTLPITNITGNTATTGGLITLDGGQSITQRGVCWSTTPSPTINSNITIDGGGTGAFTSTLTGLSTNNTYYVRAYAVNSVGVAYGDQAVFSTVPQYISISDVRSLYQNGSMTVPALKKITGVVINDFLNGNLIFDSRNMVVQDNTGGILIRFSSPPSFATGTLLDIDISGAPLTLINGVLTVGGSISVTVCSALGTGTITPRVTTLSDILQNYFQWECTLIKINNCTLTGNPTYSGIVTMNDGTYSLSLYTTSTATFANYSIPTNAVSVTGILAQYASPGFNPEIRIRNLNDIQ